MNATLVEDVAAAILYEGYILYPYRPTALKNQQRFNFGVVVPERDAAAGAGDAEYVTECLVRAAGTRTLQARARFLHLTTRQINGVDWEEAIERTVTVGAPLADLVRQPARTSFDWPASSAGGRTQARICGHVDASATAAGDGLFKVRVAIVNRTPGDAGPADPGDRMLTRSLVSTHALLFAEGGEFLSLIDPPDAARDAAAGCENRGLWPVLIGAPDDRDAMLASPIILYDHPEIAPESAGDFFDGTEIDEMLVLRILTLTDAEKQEMRDGDARARRLLEHTESLSNEHLMRLHGVLRGLRPSNEEHQT